MAMRPPVCCYAAPGLHKRKLKGVRKLKLKENKQSNENKELIRNFINNSGKHALKTLFQTF